MSRPKSGKAYGVLTVRLDHDLIEYLHIQAVKQGQTLGYYVRHHLEAYAGALVLLQEQERAQQLQQWLASFSRRSELSSPVETFDARQARIFKGLIYDMQLAIDEFGYEAVYFGVGCEVFPDAVDPWSGLDHF